MDEARLLGRMLDVADAGFGAEDVLERAREALLQLTLESERENAQLAAERQRLATEASTDGLTGLANRRHLDEYLEEHFRIASRYGTPLSVMMVDIDHFKRVNDEYGHDVGDQVLREVALTLRETMREADLCARYGGEEFVVVMPSTGLEGATECAERVRAAVERRVMFASGNKLRVTVSVGVSGYRGGEQPAAGWMVKEADMALYEAKRNGRNQVCCFQAPEVNSPWDLPVETPRRAVG
jgi:diguanylate cyclase (GGDEF)-like protein